MNRSVIATACLLVVGGGALRLLALGTWFRSPPAVVAILLVIVGAAAAAALRRMGTRWPAVVVLGYSAVFGLLMIASGAPLEGDLGPTP